MTGRDMMQYVLISPFGKDMETIFQVIRTFPIEKIILISDKEDLNEAKDFQKTVERFKVPLGIVEVDAYSIDEIFRIIKLTTESIKDKEILINVASGDKVTSCLTLCAAYVYGIKAVGVINDKVFPYPIMKFSYHNLLSEQKLKILKFLYESQDCCASLEELSRAMKMSLPLISYHINGSQRAEGLRQIGLVVTERTCKKAEIKLTELGKMLSAGYI